mgnify:CR=1 FL=1
MAQAQQVPAVARCHDVEVPPSPFLNETRIARINAGRYEGQEIAGALTVIRPGDRVLEGRSQMMVDIKKTLDREGIEIPFPHTSVYAGSHSAPFRVQLLQEESSNNKENSDGSDSAGQ